MTAIAVDLQRGEQVVPDDTNSDPSFNQAEQMMRGLVCPKQGANRRFTSASASALKRADRLGCLQESDD